VVKKVLVAETLEEAGIALLREHFEVDVRARTSEDELAGLIPAYDGLMIKTYTRVSPKVIDRAQRLKVVARAGTGLDKVDVEYARGKGIVVKNTPAANVVSVAELVFGLMLSLARRMPRADAYVRSRSGWDRDQFTGTELAGKTLGIVGFGAIGRAVAKRAQAFDMRVVAFDPLVDAQAMQAAGAECAPTVDALLPQADIVTVHVPLLDSTRHLLDGPRLKLMPAGGIVINTARGGVVDEHALVAALKSGHLAGAGLDVYEQEPPTDAALLGLPNVVLTPHIGAASAEALNRMTVQAAEIIIEALSQAG
jgi:D-3-phosphoglycerate dehydrogenase / 2-oxoglutarate reductase